MMPIHLTQHESSLQAKHYSEILLIKTAQPFIRRSNQDPQQNSLVPSKSGKHLNYSKAAFCSSLSYCLHCPLLSEIAINHFPRNHQSRNFSWRYSDVSTLQTQAAHLVLSFRSAQLWGVVFNSCVREGWEGKAKLSSASKSWFTSTSKNTLFLGFVEEDQNSGNKWQHKVALNPTVIVVHKQISPSHHANLFSSLLNNFQTTQVSVPLSAT